MSEKIRVRQATVSDIPALVDLYVENHEFQRRGFPHLKVTSAGWKQQCLPQAIAGLLGRADVAIFAAEMDDRTVGLHRGYRTVERTLVLSLDAEHHG